MPKPIINSKELENSFSKSDDILKEKNTYKSPELAFRKQRPENYVNILKDLDIEGKTMSNEKIKEIVESIKAECPELILEDTFLGVLGKCELGGSYDVHTLSLNEVFGVDEVTRLPGFGRLILKHYLRNESLPMELEKARNLARNPQYAFVEVYKTKVIAIGYDGNAAILNI